MPHILFLTLFMLFFALPSHASEPELIPEPKRMELKEGELKFSGTVLIRAQEDCKKYANIIAARLKEGELAYTFDSTARHNATVTLQISDAIDSVEAANAYAITVADNDCMIVATSRIAMLWACTTFNQLCHDKRKGFIRHTHYIELPCGEIVDWQDNDTDDFSQINTAHKFITFNALQHQLQSMAKQRVSGVYLRLSDADQWRVESGLSAHTAGQNITSEQYYTYQQLRRLTTVSQNNGMELIPILELGANSRFRNATGHAMQSVEGECLTVWIIEELFRNTDFTTLCIEMPQSHYVDKINKLAVKLRKQGSELIIKQL